MSILRLAQKRGRKYRAESKVFAVTDEKAKYLVFISHLLKLFAIIIYDTEQLSRHLLVNTLLEQLSNVQNYFALQHCSFTF